MANESYWSYQAGSHTPSFEEIPEGAFKGNADQWHQLSPGMRREIVRSFNKTKEMQVSKMDKTVAITFSGLSVAQSIAVMEFVAKISGEAAEIGGNGVVAGNTRAAPLPVNTQASTENGANSPASAPAVAPLTGMPVVRATVAAGSVHAAAGTMLDNRGVPWHPDHHSGSADAPNKKPSGEWRMKRGADKSALKAYEKQFKTKVGAGAAVTSGSPVVASAGNATVGIAGAKVVPLSRPAVVKKVPTIDEFHDRWNARVEAGNVSDELAEWFQTHFQGFPGTIDTFHNDENARKLAYEAMAS